ncbi:hypothetical protein ACFUGD_12800 [Streptomyces sp. NPDC057217]|uniref:hypothetical protein n=1 Tax=Streptomyces sp. NPDC057217 TaxID=3346054 RepID=UPI003624F78B
MPGVARARQRIDERRADGDQRDHIDQRGDEAGHAAVAPRNGVVAVPGIVGGVVAAGAGLSVLPAAVRYDPRQAEGLRRDPALDGLDDQQTIELRRWAQEWAGDIAERLQETESPPDD